MWCAPCYSSSTEILFHIRERPVSDEDDERFESAWKAKWNEREYLTARVGDHMLTQFECDLCIFLKLMKRYPLKESVKDKRLVSCIRRINLDAFWSRSSVAVANNSRSVKKLLRETGDVGLDGLFMSHEPLPFFDHCGYQVAIAMVLNSTRPGRYSKGYTQFETIRHLRSAHSSFELISARNALNHLSISNAGGFQREIVSTSTSSIWFKRFFAGCRARMGQVHKPNLALSTVLIITLLDRVNLDCRELKSQEEKFDKIVFGTHVVISYVLSLRGSEGLMLNLTALCREDKIDRKYCVVPLKGKVKGESIERDHVLPCCLETSSGIKVGSWIKMIILAHGMAGRRGGPAITDWKGSILSVSALDAISHDYLELLHADGIPFPQEIKSEEDIRERFSVHRSFRRASNTRAINQKVDISDVDVINRWKSVEAAQGKKPSRPMRQHYAEGSSLLEPFLRYTKAM